MIKTKGKSTKKLIFSLIIIVISVILIVVFLHQKQKKITPPPYIGKIKKNEKFKRKKPTVHYLKIAIIIDDVGYPVSTFRYYLNFKGKLTFSVLPHLHRSRSYAEKLHKNGFEIMIHIPMEPINYPKVNPGPGALLIDDNITTIYRKIKSMISENPWAVGANNHMGSRLTQDCQKMNVILKALKKKNLFFIDSLTTSKSCAYKEAVKLKIPFAKRDIFLDNKNDYNYIKRQFFKLINIAKYKGYGIGIGHIQNRQTIRVLKSMQFETKKYGFHFVFVSEIVSSN